MISIHAPRTGSDRSAVTAAHRWSAFQSTLPARGATIRPVLRCFPKPISIHAPRTGSDKIVFDAATQRTHFNPRSPHGERRLQVCVKNLPKTFQSTLPARGATQRRKGGKRSNRISIHAPRTGSDPDERDYKQLYIISIHAPRTGSDLWYIDCGNREAHFNPRSPHGERRVLAPDTTFHMNHFNPRSPHGERRPPSARASSPKRFQSTLPARGATATRGLASTSASHFNPRSPHGERLPRSYSLFFSFRFQSTLPARGATRGQPRGQFDDFISIHAPRTGSDMH